MRLDIPYKKLHAKHASDIALAIARGECKRLDDVLARIGGIDASAIHEALEPRHGIASLVAQRSDSGGLLRRTLARAPQELFDEIALELSWEKRSFVFNRAARYGLGREPRAMEKFMLAFKKAGQEANELLACHVEVLVCPKGVPVNGMQRETWNAASFQVEAMLLDHFVSLGTVALGSIKEQLAIGGRSVSIIERALAALERGGIEAELNAHGSVKTKKAPSL